MKQCVEEEKFSLIILKIAVLPNFQKKPLISCYLLRETYRFFKGIRSLYRYQKRNGGSLVHTNKNPFKKAIAEDVRREMEKK